MVLGSRTRRAHGSLERMDFPGESHRSPFAFFPLRVWLIRQQTIQNSTSLCFRQKGLILNISSGVALFPWPLYSMYSASKVSDSMEPKLPSPSSSCFSQLAFSSGLQIIWQADGHIGLEDKCPGASMYRARQQMSGYKLEKAMALGLMEPCSGISAAPVGLWAPLTSLPGALFSCCQQVTLELSSVLGAWPGVPMP